MTKLAKKTYLRKNIDFAYLLSQLVGRNHVHYIHLSAFIMSVSVDRKKKNDEGEQEHK